CCRAWSAPIPSAGCSSWAPPSSSSSSSLPAASWACCGAGGVCARERSGPGDPGGDARLRRARSAAEPGQHLHRAVDVHPGRHLHPLRPLRSRRHRGRAAGPGGSARVSALALAIPAVMRAFGAPVLLQSLVSTYTERWMFILGATFILFVLF